MGDWLAGRLLRLALRFGGERKVVYARGMEHFGYDDPDSAHYKDDRVRFPAEWFAPGGRIDQLLALERVHDEGQRSISAGRAN